MKNRRIEKSAWGGGGGGGYEGRRYMSLRSRGDMKKLAMTQNFFNSKRDEDDTENQGLNQIQS